MPSLSTFLLLLSLFLLTLTTSSSAQIVQETTDPCPLLSDGSQHSCPVNCFISDPVCGVDNVTYWCGCLEAACAGVTVAAKGYCEVKDGAASPVSGQALLLVHIVWLFVLGFSVLFGFL